MTTIKLAELNSLINRYTDKGGVVYTIEGALLDNYIMVGEGLKTIIVRSKCLNEWSSCNTIRMYNKCPQKYAQVVELLDEGKEEEAEKMFFS